MVSTDNRSPVQLVPITMLSVQAAHRRVPLSLSSIICMLLDKGL